MMPVNGKYMIDFPVVFAVVFSWVRRYNSYVITLLWYSFRRFSTRLTAGIWRPPIDAVNR